MPALIIRSTQKTSIDDDTNSKGRDIAWSPIFFAISCTCLGLNIPSFLIKKFTLSRFSKIQVESLTNILVNV